MVRLHRVGGGAAAIEGARSEQFPKRQQPGPLRKGNGQLPAAGCGSTSGCVLGKRSREGVCGEQLTPWPGS